MNELVWMLWRKWPRYDTFILSQRNFTVKMIHLFSDVKFYISEVLVLIVSFSDDYESQMTLKTL